MTKRDKKLEPRSWSSVKSLMKKNVVDMAPIYQRDFVWSVPMQSDFIVSMLENKPTGQFILNQKENNNIDIPAEHIFELADGKQRLGSALNFDEGKFMLTPQASKKIIEEYKPYFVKEQAEKYAAALETIKEADDWNANDADEAEKYATNLNIIENSEGWNANDADEAQKYADALKTIEELEK